jgi:hypothetical protein
MFESVNTIDPFDVHSSASMSSDAQLRSVVATDVGSQVSSGFDESLARMTAASDDSSVVAVDDSSAMEQEVLAGFDLGINAKLGTLSLFSGMLGMIFVMYRRRQA